MERHLDAQDDFADTVSERMALWAGTLGLVAAVGLSLFVIGLSV